MPFALRVAPVLPLSHSPWWPWPRSPGARGRAEIPQMPLSLTDESLWSRAECELAAKQAAADTGAEAIVCGLWPVAQSDDS